MNNTFIFVRHGEPKQDTSMKVKDWSLSERGNKQAEALANSGKFDNIDLIVTSSQKKAYQTALPLASKLKVDVYRMKDFNELDRNAEVFLSNHEFEEIKEKMFDDLDYSQYGWESSRAALTRFLRAVHKLKQKYYEKNIMIISHGTILSLYFSFMTNNIDMGFERWKRLDFCDSGMVFDNRKVMKDIV